MIVERDTIVKLEFLNLKKRKYDNIHHVFFLLTI